MASLALDAYAQVPCGCSRNGVHAIDESPVLIIAIVLAVGSTTSSAIGGLIARHMDKPPNRR